MVTIKYVVELGYLDEYEFRDRTTALTFAEMAMTHRTEKVDEVKVVVRRIESEEENND